MLASTLGSWIGSALYAFPFSGAAPNMGSLLVEMLLMFAGSMFTCWLIYRLRVDQEDAEAVQGRRNSALAFVFHELRQPLSSIKLAATILERACRVGCPSPCHERQRPPVPTPRVPKTLVRSLVTQHGGRIVARNDGPGRGSTFVVELPLLPTAPSRAV